MENENDPSEKDQSDSTDQTEEQESEDGQKEEDTGSEESPADSTDQLEEQKSDDEQKEKADEKKMILYIVGGAVLLILLVVAAFFIFRKGDTQKVDKVQTEEVKGDAKISAEAFSYDLWPFVNRSKNMRLLMPRLRKIEKELVEKIKSLPEDKKIIIYGYTSREKSRQNKKKEKGNVVLSTRRAKAIVKYLADKYKIDKDRFEIKAQGSKDLEVKKPTWAVRNRRVVITSEE